MKASKFTEAQKAFILQQGHEGMAVAEICRKAGISQATYFNWKKKYDGLLPTEMRRLKQLEDENGTQGCGRPQPRQGDAAGRDPPKTLRPARKRKLARCVASGTCRSVGLPGAGGRHVVLSLPISSPWAGRAGGADPGDL